MSIDRYKLHNASAKSKGQAPQYDAKVLIRETAKGQKGWKSFIPESDAALKSQLEELAERQQLKPEPGQTLWYQSHPLERSAIVLLDQTQTPFKLLGLARQIVAQLKASKARSIRLELAVKDKALAAVALDAFVSAFKAAEFRSPRYGAAPKDAPFDFAPSLDIISEDKGLAKVLSRALHEGDGTNLVRELAMLAGNDLTPRRYSDRLKKEAKAEGLGYEFLDVKKLQALKAGAFLAVAQASPEQDAGIVKLSYTPKKKAKKHLALVGKGITYDTGGTNLKSAQYMYGMHKDMAGSAVAYALVRMAAREKWDIAVTAYLALCDNLTGPKAYRPNDVVTAANGKTIEIVHTDAEGRMVLADTLYFASQGKPDLILDFATLTGACVGAIGSSYSGAFTNREAKHGEIIAAGKESGERVWPFPLDEDFGECLKSETADTKQCRLTGGVDHIEAAIFLRSFLANDDAWLHIDLSSADHSGGLAHVDNEVTGFGVRFASRFLRRDLGIV